MIWCNFKLATFLALALTVYSSPIENKLGDNCIVTAYSGVATAVSTCTNIVINGITVPAGTTLELSLKTGTTLTFKGTIKWAHSNWAGPLIEIKGSKVTVVGTGATLDGQGALYWDGLGDKGVKKPKFFRIKTTGGSNFNNIKLLNCPHQCVSINTASDTTLSGWTVDVSAGDSGGGHNTDGFDLSSSSGITIKNTVVKNQDDCVAVNQGSNYVFKNLTCSGGHGLSLSVGQSTASGSANTVKNVTFSDCSVINSRNGIHVKTHTDAGTGSISGVKYTNIKMSGITAYGINVQQDYKGGKSTKDPKGNIPITGLDLTNISGTMSGAKNSVPVYILCGSSGCKSWTWSKVTITNGKSSDSCNFTPTGFTC